MQLLMVEIRKIHTANFYRLDKLIEGDSSRDSEYKVLKQHILNNLIMVIDDTICGINRSTHFDVPMASVCIEKLKDIAMVAVASMDEKEFATGFEIIETIKEVINKPQ